MFNKRNKSEKELIINLLNLKKKVKISEIKKKSLGIKRCHLIKYYFNRPIFHRVYL